MSHSNTSDQHVNKNINQPTSEVTPTQNIFRTIKNKQNPYVQINRIPLNDASLSWKAKGLLSYMMSLPDGWEVHISEIMKHGRDKLESITAGFKELQLAGYIHRYQDRQKGKFKAWVTLVYEVPELNPHYKLAVPERGKPLPGKPQAGNPKLVITEGSKTDCINNYSSGSPTVDEKDYSETKIKRNLIAMKRAKEIPQETDIEQKVKEIFFHTQHRNLSITRTEEHAYKAAIQLLKAGKWKAPTGMLNEDSIAREERARQEKLQEIKETKGSPILTAYFSANAANGIAEAKAAIQKMRLKPQQ